MKRKTIVLLLLLAVILASTIPARAAEKSKYTPSLTFTGTTLRSPGQHTNKYLKGVTGS